jgi:hypothetical protein
MFTPSWPYSCVVGYRKTAIPATSAKKKILFCAKKSFIYHNNKITVFATAYSTNYTVQFLYSVQSASIRCPWSRQADNEGKSAASVCHQMAALVPDMFCKIADNSATTTEAREKNKHILRILDQF